MENKLRSMMDFQRYQPNDRLSRMIAQTQSRYGAKRSKNAEELSDDALAFVNAAGEIDPFLGKEKDPDE